MAKFQTVLYNYTCTYVYIHICVHTSNKYLSCVGVTLLALVNLKAGSLAGSQTKLCWF